MVDLSNSCAYSEERGMSSGYERMKGRVWVEASGGWVRYVNHVVLGVVDSSDRRLLA